MSTPDGERHNWGRGGTGLLTHAVIKSAYQLTVEPQKKQQVLQDEFNIPMTKKFVEVVTELCNLSRGVMEKGRLNGLLDSVRALMDSAHVSAEEAMDMPKISSKDGAVLKESMEKDA